MVFFLSGATTFVIAEEPFATAAGPEKIYVLTSYRDIAVAFRNTTTLDYGLVIRDLMGRLRPKRKMDQNDLPAHENLPREHSEVQPTWQGFFPPQK